MTAAELLLWLPPLVPLLAAAAAAAAARMPEPRAAAMVGAAGAVAGLLACVALALVARPGGVLVSGPLRADALSAWLLLPAATVGLAAALRDLAPGRRFAAFPRAMGRPVVRARPAGSQALLGAHHLALLVDGFVPGWVAALLTVLATLPLLAARAGVDAAWRALVFCAAGLALALFGLVLLLCAVPPGWDAAVVPLARPELPALGFLFVLLGYGALAGLAPAHLWMFAVLARGGAAGAVVFALLASVAFHGILRAQDALRGVAEAGASAGRLAVALGALSLGLAALTAWRNRGARWRVARSGAGQAGLALLCFGLGAPLAGLLFLGGSSLLLLAFGCAAAPGEAESGEGVPVRDRPSRGMAGWAAALAVAGLAGLPPFASFAAALDLTTAAARGVPWLLLPVCLGLAGLGAALAGTLRVPRPCLPERGGPVAHGWSARLAAASPWLCLAAALLLGLVSPPLLIEAARGIAP